MGTVKNRFPVTDNLSESYRLILCGVITILALSSMVYANAMNGFDLSTTSIDVTQIFTGGPPRDGIPSIDSPKFVPVKDVDYLTDDDIVIGFTHASSNRAYPTRILIWHEIVNDTVGDFPFSVTYCPLCGTAMVFERNIDGQLRTFGVSGLLYQSDVLMYDRESESLWSQLGMEAISGPAIGEGLVWLPSEHLTWKAWRQKYPGGEVLSTDTGYDRNYGENVYSSYFESDTTMFPVVRTRQELPEKEWVVGVIVDGKAKAYPVAELPDNTSITDRIGNRNIVVRYDAKNRYPQISYEDGETIASVMVYWFAWQAFYPETLLWRPN